MRFFFNIISLTISFITGIALLSACDKVEIDPNYNEEEAFKVLILGNSLSRDAFSYAPWIMESISENFSIDMEILYVGGSVLSTHYSYIVNDSEDFIQDIYTSKTHTWASFPGIKASDVIQDKKWDLIVFQEGNGNCRNLSQFSDNVDHLINYFEGVLEDPHFSIMMNPARPDGASALGTSTSLEDYGNISNVASLMLDNPNIEFIIPCGTAVQHARRMSLDKFGDFGHLSYDGKHLQDGIPCQIEGYTVAQSLIDYTKRTGAIENCKIKANSKWVDERYIPGKHGHPLTGSDIQYELTKLCARMAIEEPFSLDYITFKHKYPNLFGSSDFLLQAHRGFSMNYPENTALAFEEAGKIPEYKAIETDVQCTKDGVLVCMHDENIERTTNGSGEIKNLTWSQLQAKYIDGGNGWDDKYSNTLKIPKFEEFLDICSKYGKIPYVELKSLSSKEIKEVINLLHSKGFTDDKYVFTSFSESNLEIAAKNCDAPLEIMKKEFTEEELEEYATKKNYTVRPVAEVMTAEYVKKCHDLGMFVENWNISTDKTSAAKIISMGVDGGTCNNWDILSK